MTAGPVELRELGLTPPLDQAMIARLIPQAGEMCLLDTVLAWDADGICCQTERHRNSAHPLRRANGLAAVHACEYGAQAAAVHGGLCARAAGQTAPPGYLAALREVQWWIDDLATVDGPLEVTARRLLGDAAQCVYAIAVTAAGQMLAQARVTIAPQPAATTTPVSPR